MRFGIMTLQHSELFPPGLPPEQALAHLATLSHAELVSELYDCGFNPIEISGDLALFLPHTLQPTAIDELRQLKTRSNITYTVHLPLWSVEPSTALAPVREGSIQAVIDALVATLSLEPEVYVLHATGALAAEFYRMDLPAMASGFLLRQFQSHAMASIETILSKTGLESRRLAIETIEFPFELTLELAEALDLSICLDVGHILSGFSGAVDLFDALERCLPRLAEVHLHDSLASPSQQQIVYGQDHRPLGHGDLDAARLLDRLKAAAYSGPLIFELSIEEALASLAWIRSQRPEVLL